MSAKRELWSRAVCLRDAGVADPPVSQTVVCDRRGAGQDGAGAYQRAVKRATKA